MADINVQRKKSSAWPWILGVLVLGLGIWAVAEMIDTDDVATVTEEIPPAATPEPPPEPVTGATVGIAAIRANPSRFAGQPFPAADVRVADVVGDRAFWVEQNGERLLVITTQPSDVSAGDMLHIDGGIIRDATYVTQLVNQFDEAILTVVRREPVYLIAGPNDIETTSGTGTP